MSPDSASGAPPSPSLRRQALEALLVADPDAKMARTHRLWAAFEALGDDADLVRALCIDEDIRTDESCLPGRPGRPLLIPPAEVPHRSPFTPEGLAALLHAIAHIEFNAINLALDAVWRFANMPAAFYRDWIRVAHEEATHFALLRAELRLLDHDYGDFPAHDGLWEMCIKTREDIVARMALVPRTLEARGLDATPLIQARLRKVGSPAALRAIAALDIILRDEVGHVAIGNHWYGWLCQREHLDPIAHYRVLARRHEAPRPRPPFNEAARQRAGFSPDEMAYLYSQG
ncbi:ferritin-like domain-containing protein [Hydrogenophaga sp.]|uniref:ferritin-like domain-containing protein n=1 Tax=Hydrogenophaga sp. TaxID=1904254 RepID=UPI0035B3FD56